MPRTLLYTYIVLITRRGRVFKELGYNRHDLVITTKIFWGTRSNPNSTGLSRKHIIEGTQDSLKRLQMDYVDVIFAHRPDDTGARSMTPFS